MHLSRNYSHDPHSPLLLSQHSPLLRSLTQQQLHGSAHSHSQQLIELAAHRQLHTTHKLASPQQRPFQEKNLKISGIMSDSFQIQPSTAKLVQPLFPVNKLNHTKSEIAFLPIHQRTIIPEQTFRNLNTFQQNQPSIHNRIISPNKFLQRPFPQHHGLPSFDSIPSSNPAKQQGTCIDFQKELKSILNSPKPKTTKVFSDAQILQILNKNNNSFKTQLPKSEFLYDHKLETQFLNKIQMPLKPFITPPFINKQIPVPNFSPQNLLRGKMLGVGKYGNVYAVIDKQTGMIFAQKSILKKTIEMQQMHGQLALQLKCQAKFQHPNLVPVLGVYDTPSNINIIQPLFMTSLEKLGRLSEEKAAKGLIYIHSKGYIHRDVKPENVFIFGNQCALGDFGWINKQGGFVGTPDFVSPQIVMNQTPGPKVDVWALGVLTYQLILGRTPFRTDLDINNIVKTQPDYSGVSQQGQQFLRRCLQKQVSLRSSLLELRNQIWLQRTQEQPIGQLIL